MPLLFESERMNSIPKKIDPQLRARCVRPVREHQQEHPTPTAAVVAVARRLVGWQVSKPLYTGLALDALEMGLWNSKSSGPGCPHLRREVLDVSIGQGKRRNAVPQVIASLARRPVVPV